MSLRAIAIALLAATALSGAARADDQAEETRRLNEMQLENPGAGVDAVPPGDPDVDPYDDDPYGDPSTDDGYDAPPDDDGVTGQGGPYNPEDPYDDTYDDEAPDDGAAPDADAYDPDEEYPPDDVEPGDAEDEVCDPDDCDPDAGAYPDHD